MNLIFFKSTKVILLKVLAFSALLALIVLFCVAVILNHSRAGRGCLVLDLLSDLEGLLRSHSRTCGRDLILIHCPKYLSNLLEEKIPSISIEILVAPHGQQLLPVCTEFVMRVERGPAASEEGWTDPEGRGPPADSRVKSCYSTSPLECLFGSTETRPAVSQLVTQEEAQGMEK